MISELKDIDIHRNIAKRQRDSYNNDKNHLDLDTLLIEMDWKQKVLIGNKSRTFFNPLLRTTFINDIF